MPTSWSHPIDHYCERTDAGFWAEPLNAISNGAFLVAAAYALLLWRRKGAGDWAALWLIAVTTIVGIGSFLFHTFANRWALLADVLPIAVFIYSYFLLAMRRFLSLGLVAAIAATVLFAAFNISFGRLWFALLPGVTLNGSVGYIPAALAMLGVGLVCLMGKEGRAGRCWERVASSPYPCFFAPSTAQSAPRRPQERTSSGTDSTLSSSEFS